MLKRDPDKQAQRDSEKLQRQAQQDIEKQRKQAEQEAKAFAATPRGQARNAFEAGDGFFQYAGALSETKRKATSMLTGEATSSGQKRRTTVHTDTLSQIEDEGWLLEDVGYVFEHMGSVSRDKFLSSGQTETVNGQILGVYLFRRNENHALAA